MSVVLLALSSGCVVQRIQTSDGDVAAPAVTPSCDPESIRMAHDVIDETSMWVTVARRVVVEDRRVRSATVPWNQPMRPEVRWRSARKAGDADVILKIPDELRKSVAMEDSPSLDRVVSFMAGRTSADGTYVGFVAVKRVLLGFAINCAGDRDRSLDPVFVSWADAEIGVVDCDREPAAAPKASRYVKAEYC